MMESIRFTAIKLGVFTVVTVVVTTWLAAIIGNIALFSKPYEVSAEFSDATGVLIGDVVKAAGVSIGRVEEIRTERGIAVVRMSIQEDAQLPAGLRAQVRFRNLVGQRMITLVEDETASSAGLLQDGELIPLERTDSAFDLSALFNGLRPLIRSTDPADINLVAKAMVEALKGRGAEVESFLANVAEISDMVASKDHQIESLLDNVNTVTSDLAGRDAQLQTTLAALNGFMGDVAASKDDMSAALTNIDSAATTFGRIVAKNDKNIEAELADLATIFDAVNDRRNDLRKAIRALPDFLIGAERVNSYGQWSMLHVINVCKDDHGDCGRRWMP